MMFEDLVKSMHDAYDDGGEGFMEMCHAVTNQTIQLSHPGPESHPR